MSGWPFPRFARHMRDMWLTGFDAPRGMIVEFGRAYAKRAAGVPFAADHVPRINQEPAAAADLPDTRVMDVIATSRPSGKTRTFDNAQGMVCCAATLPGTRGAARRSGRSGRLRG